jgi:hypothetical protein
MIARPQTADKTSECPGAEKKKLKTAKVNNRKLGSFTIVLHTI